jgi:formylglycine-generating enzyme required for sulfatase activity
VSGGDFYRSNQSAAKATVSTFTMDKYEVTQGRFSRFVNWSYGMFGMPPQAGAGKMAHNPNYAGWLANYPLPTTKQAMLDLLACDPDATYGTTNPNMPVNCVNYYAAYAFCIWDGGRLPTEAEWNYAAAGGAEQRFYPWSDPPSSTLIDTSFASFADGGNVLAPVGSFTKGYGLYGQADLAGNVSEWALDYFSSAYQVPCTDCIDVTYAMTQSARGGSYTSAYELLKTATRSAYAPDELQPYLGFRCVHDL